MSRRVGDQRDKDLYRRRACFFTGKDLGFYLELNAEHFLGFEQRKNML